MRFGKEEFNWIIKPIVTEAEKLEELLPNLGEKELEKLANNILYSLLINERGLFPITEEINSSIESKGIKNKYKDFNVEHFMGYEVKRHQNGKISIIYKPNRAARVCSSKGIDLDELIDKENFAYSQADNILREVIRGKLQNQNDPNMIAEHSDGSKYILRNKDICFVGFHPIFISNMEEIKKIKKGNNEFCLNYLKEHQENKTITFNNEEEFKNSDILSFNDVLTNITNALSHGNITEKGDLFIIAASKTAPNGYFKKGSLLVSKSWLKAVIEAEVKAKDQYPSAEAIEDSLRDYLLVNKDIPLDRDSIQKMLTTLFAINKGSLEFMTGFILATFKDSEGIKIEEQILPSVSLALDLFQENFDSEFDLKGVPIPAKLFLSLLSEVDNAYVKGEVKSSETYKFLLNKKGENGDYPFTVKLREATNKIKYLGRSFSSAYVEKMVRSSVRDLVAELQGKLNEKNKFFRFNIAAPKKYNDFRSEILDKMQILALILSSTFDHVNNFYENISVPVNYFGGKPVDSPSLKATSLVTSDNIFDVLYADDKLMPAIINKFPNIFNDFALSINSQEYKLRDYQLDNVKHYRFALTKIISRIRNSIAHSGVSLFVDDKNLVKFCFNEINNFRTGSEVEQKRADVRSKTKPPTTSSVECSPLKYFDLFSSLIISNPNLTDSLPFEELEDYGYEGISLKLGKKAISAESGKFTVTIDGEKIEPRFTRPDHIK